MHTHKLDLVNEGEIAGGERSAAGRGEARRGERERLGGEKKKKRWMHVCGGEKTLGLVVGSPARLYSCQNSFIRIIHLSSAVCLCVCGSSSVGGLACLLLRCYNLPGSGGTIISSMSFLLLLLLFLLLLLLLLLPLRCILYCDRSQDLCIKMVFLCVSVSLCVCVCVCVCVVAHVSERGFLCECIDL